MRMGKSNCEKEKIKEGRENETAEKKKIMKVG